jgi:hypothetical protein
VRLNALALMVCLMAPPSLAWADDTGVAASTPDVVATAAGTPAAPNTAAASPLTRWMRDAPPVTGLGDDDQNGVLMIRPDRAVHGEVGFGVGTNGYRDAYAAISLPVGQTSRLGVAVEDEQYGKRWKVERRSLDVNLALGGASAAPEDCGSAIRVGDRYVEPLWATHIRGSALQDVDPRCISAGPQPR